MKKRIIVGLSGASGAVYGLRALSFLRTVPEVETHLVMTAAARRTIVEETLMTVKEVEALADVVHDHRDIGSLSELLCLRHTMTTRSQYAKQTQARSGGC